MSYDKTPLEQALAKQLRLPNLTATEEVDLARKVRAWLDDPAPSPAVVRVGRRARDTLVTRNLRLAAQFVMRRQSLWRHTTLEFNDVMSHAVLGLQRAAERHNLDGAYRYSTVATWWMRSYVTRGIQDEGRTIRVPGNIQTVWSRVRKGIEPHDHLTLAAEQAHACMSIDAIRPYNGDDDEPVFDPPAPPPPPEADHEILERIWTAAGPEHHALLESIHGGKKPTPTQRRKLQLALSTVGEIACIAA